MLLSFLYILNTKVYNYTKKNVNTNTNNNNNNRNFFIYKLLTPQ